MRSCEHCGDSIDLDPDDQWFHVDTGVERCEGVEAVASPDNEPTEAELERWADPERMAKYDLPRHDTLISLVGR